MSSHPYVTQQNTPLADDTTLMSTTDLQSYITHANDTFVQVSGFTLQELQGQPHNMVRHPDMPKAAFADMWFTLKKGEPWSGIVKNRRKNGDHYWVRANAVPMVREGKISGYMSIRTRATDEEIAAVEPLYKALNAGRTSKRIHKGLVVRKGWLGKLPSLPLRWRARGVMTLMFILLAAMLWFVAAPVVTYFLCVLVVLLASACFEWQIVRPIENVARQALKVATGERNSVEHLNRSDELGLTLRAVGQLGLMCRWLINDVSSQVSSVRNGSETLAKGTDELNEHTAPQETEGLLRLFNDGNDVGLISEAGLPAVADPGADLVALAHRHGIEVIPYAGPSSLMLALMASGLNGQSFAFCGYLPAKTDERRERLRTIERLSASHRQTQIFIETPYRNDSMLADILSVCRGGTRLCIAANVTMPDAFIRTRTVEQWKNEGIAIGKRPCVFCLLA